MRQMVSVTRTQFLTQCVELDIVMTFRRPVWLYGQMMELIAISLLQKRNKCSSHYYFNKCNPCIQLGYSVSNKYTLLASFITIRHT